MLLTQRRKTLIPSSNFTAFLYRPWVNKPLFLPHELLRGLCIPTKLRLSFQKNMYPCMTYCIETHLNNLWFILFLAKYGWLALALISRSSQIEWVICNNRWTSQITCITVESLYEVHPPVKAKINIPDFGLFPI